MSTIAGSIANIALPNIAHAFRVSAADSVWVVNGTQLAMTATLLFFAALGDARGPKPTYIGGLIVFTLATLGCACAPSFDVLIAMRVMQGLGASALIVTTNSLTRALYPKEMLGRSVAFTALFVAVGTAAGPSVGGLILAFAPWQWIFGFTVPLALAGLALARYLPAVPASGAKLDYRSGALAALGFGGLIYAIDGIARSMPIERTGPIGIAGAIAMVLFVRTQLRSAEPMLAVELFRRRIFSVAVLASTATYTAQGLAYVSLPFFFQSVLGRTPLEAGLLLAAWPVMAFVVATQIGPLSDRYSASRLCTIGIVVMGLGLGLFALLPAAPATWAIVACAAVGGAGFATFQTPNNRAIISSAPVEQTGRATGVMAAARLTGQTCGAALVAIVFEAVGTPGGTRVTRADIEATLLTACGFIALAAVLSAVRWGAGRAKVAVAG